MKNLLRNLGDFRELILDFQRSSMMSNALPKAGVTDKFKPNPNVRSFLLGRFDPLEALKF